MAAAALRRFGKDGLRLAFIGACFVVHPQVAQAVAELWAILKDWAKFFTIAPGAEDNPSILGASWVVISRVISMVIKHITPLKVLI